VEAFNSLKELRDGDIDNHRQLHEIIVGNYDLLKKGRYGMTKTAFKRLEKAGEFVPAFIPEKTRESHDIQDWNRSDKIGFSIDLMSGVDEDLAFPPGLMKKIRNSKVPSIASLSGNQKKIAWFCIQEIEERQTKNGKVFYRMKVCDNNLETSWLRVWTKFQSLPSLYTIWIAEVASTESWGCSTSSYKMKQINI
jgi:hypothetical protein